MAKDYTVEEDEQSRSGKSWGEVLIGCGAIYYPVAFIDNILAIENHHVKLVFRNLNIIWIPDTVSQMLSTYVRT
jgi:hypothetical protein